MGYVNVRLLQSLSLKRKLQDQYIREWLVLLDTASSSINYRQIKLNFECSEYFKILTDNLSLNLLRFRTRNHRLPVEERRCMGKPLQVSNCEFCNNDVGKEF